jgi:hypothetical protein
MKTAAGWILLLMLLADSAAAHSRIDLVQDAPAQRPETYESAAIDANGNLSITTSDFRLITVLREGKQSSFRAPIVSRDRTSVGALAEYPNCCTSYDIPLQLVVYSNGRTHRFKGIELAMFEWHFADGGSRVAYGQQTVHLGCDVQYELRDVESERLIDSARVPVPCGQHPDPLPTAIPPWVKALNTTSR